MNENGVRFDENEKNTYRATSNLNTAIENPQINMNSVVDVNIKSIDSANSMNVYDSMNNYGPVNESFSNPINTDSVNSFQGNQSFNSNNYNNNVIDGQIGVENSQANSYFVPGDLNTNMESQSTSNFVSDYGNVATSSNEQVTYEPVMQETKKRGVTVKVNRELKVMIFIVLILFIFILAIPYIYDFFKELQLVITT